MNNTFDFFVTLSFCIITLASSMDKERSKEEKSKRKKRIDCMLLKFVFSPVKIEISDDILLKIKANHTSYILHLKYKSCFTQIF